MDEGWLNQFLLDKAFEESDEVLPLALRFVRLLELVSAGEVAELGDAVGEDIDAGIFLHRVCHRNLLPRGLEVQADIAVGDLEHPMDLNDD